MAGTSLSSETLPYAQPVDEILSFTPTADVNSINLRYNKNTASAQAWLNFITLNARSPLRLESSSLIFRDQRSQGPGNISEFQIGNAPDAVVWDITPSHQRQDHEYHRGRQHTEIYHQHRQPEGVYRIYEARAIHP